MITATRRLQYAIGHRVFGHESKCANFHGHNYVFHFSACLRGSSGLDGLDNIGRVIDFSVLKYRIGKWLEEVWDHGFIVFEGDENARAALALIPGQKYMVVKFNPTAENIAQHLLKEMCPILLAGTNVHVYKVVIEETENCFATAEEAP